MNNLKYIHLTWNEIERDCFCICSDIEHDGYKPDCIIGLMRGGIIPARLFADYFDIPFEFYALNVNLYKGIDCMNDKLWIESFHHTLADKRVLIVDDIWDSGRTMKGILDYLNPSEELRNNNPLYHDVPINDKTVIKTATLFLRENSADRPDYYCEIAPTNNWIIYPWEKFDFDNEMRKGKHEKENI